MTDFIPDPAAADAGSAERAAFRTSVRKAFRVRDGEKFRLAAIDPGETLGFDIGKDAAKEHLASGIRHLRPLQERLYAGERHAVLIVLQAMDTAGKDGAIEHVMSGINPQGCTVTSFKQPSAAELRHDFLWRSTLALPERGRIGIFNRSYYEEVLVVRVHPELLIGQGIAEVVDGDFWRARYKSIRNYERHLRKNGTTVLKLFLHISRDEQKKRLLERIEEPDKNWKFSLADVDERGHWDEYQRAYEAMIRATATAEAPWYVLPANDKWFARLAVCSVLVETLERLDLAFPEVSDRQRAALEEGRRRLEAE